MSTDNLLKPGVRGPVEHGVRDQIIQAAEAHFRQYGYAKTTVSDLAAAIGFSKAYIYKFFDSKQAIGDAICARSLTGMLADAQTAVDEAGSASDKIRILFRAVVDRSVTLLFEDRKLYELGAHAAVERWPSGVAYEARLAGMVRQILLEGRQSGEFERKTPVDEICRAIGFATLPFVHPVTLERHLDLLPDALNEVIGLILRSLAP